jgi:hypothetical protein
MSNQITPLSLKERCCVIQKRALKKLSLSTIEPKTQKRWPHELAVFMQLEEYSAGQGSITTTAGSPKNSKPAWPMAATLSLPGNWNFSAKKDFVPRGNDWPNPATIGRGRYNHPPRGQNAIASSQVEAWRAGTGYRVPITAEAKVCQNWGEKA